MSRTRRWGGLIVVTGLLALAGGTGPGARGQVKVEEKKVAPGFPRAKAEPKAFTDAVTVPTNRESRQLIQAAQDYIKKKEWQVAAGCLQSLLEAKEDSFIEVEGKDDKGNTTKRRVSVRIEANRLIGELPPEGLEFYQITYGPAADSRLKEALEKNDPSILADVAVRFLHTKAGAEASNLLGTYHLDRGSYLMAALSFERLLTRPDADKLPFKVLFKAALAFRRAGDTENAEKLWKKLADKAGRGELVVGRQKVTLDQLRREFERADKLLAQLGQNDWPVFRGNPARNAQGVGSTSYLEPRWQASMLPLDDSNPLVTHDQVEATARLRELLPLAFASLEGKPILPTFFPIAANGKLIYRTYDGVYAVSLKDADTADGKVKAGELLWMSPAKGGLHGMLIRPDRRVKLEEWYKNYYANPSLGPAGVLFENSVTGSLSHDGQRVYFVDDLAVPPHPGVMATQNMGGSAGYGPFDAEVHFNRLTCVELDTGRVFWTIGDRNTSPTKDTDEKKESPVAGQELLDTFFLGPPLPLGGKLYLLAEKNTELRLICLDPTRLVTYGDNNKSPVIVWQQSLGTANFRLPQDSLRRLQAAHLAYGDGILVCPTNAGIVLGVDLLSHSLVWAHSYRDGNPQPFNDEMNMMMVRGRIFRGGMPVMPGAPARERWRPSAPVIQGGKVVFTAFDGDGGALHCLNLRDGRLLWHISRKDDDLYLGGVFGPHVVIVGKTYVRALNLDDGKELWTLPTGSLPSGQGAASDNVYYLPLQAVGEKKEPGVLAVNLATGKPVSVPAKSRKKEPLGNLLFVDGELISQTALTVSDFPELKRMLAEIDRRLKENPNDPVGLTERGELYLDKGELALAVNDLRTALAHRPPSDTRVKARTKLHEALTEQFQSDFNAAEKYLDEYHDLCKVEAPSDADPATRQKLADEQLRREANYLSLVGRGRESQGRLLDALAAYEQFGALTGNKELVSSIDEKNTRSRPDVWSRGRIKGMIDHATPGQRQQLEAAMAKRWEALRDKNDLDAVRKFVGVFGTSFRVGREAQLHLAEQLLAAGGPDDLTEAETKLQALCFSPELRRQDPATAAKAVEAMIRIYVRRGLYEDAVGLYKQLGSEFADVKVRDDKTGAELLHELFTDKRFLPYLEPQGLQWRGALKAQDVPGSYPAMQSSLTVVPEGELLPFFQRHRLVLDMNMQGGNAWQLRLVDRATNEERWKQYNLPAAFYFISNQQPGFINNNPQNNFYFFNNAPPRHFAFAKGHNLVLHLNNQVFAFNLAERKEVWRYNLYGKNPLLNNNVQIRTELDPEGRVSVIYPDGRRELMGGVAVVESNYVCLQARVGDEVHGGYRDGLIALDPNRPGPSVLWTKADIPLRAQVFGDDQHVYVVETGSDQAPPKVLALRAQDGVSVPVPDFGRLFARRVQTLGRRLLLHEDDPQGGKVLRLYDVQTGQDVWRKGFSAGALVLHSVDPDRTGVIEKDHTVTFLDVHTGRVLFKSLIQAEHAEKLQGAALVTDHDHFFLALSRAPEHGLNWWPNSGAGMRSLRINGPLYALSRTSGKLEWVCDFLPHQALLLEQVQDLPILLFTTQYNKTGVNGSMERQAVRVTGVDKRTGKLLYDKEFAPSNQFQSLRTDPQAGLIELVRPDLKIAFRVENNQAAMADPSAAPAAAPVTAAAPVQGFAR
jgi:outer membrane protein assembly factor BamB